MDIKVDQSLQAAESRPEPIEAKVLPVPEKKAPTVRRFTSADGKTISAQILSAEGRNVSIRRVDGEEFTVPVTMFVEADQVYIAEWRAENGAPSASPSTSPGSRDDVDWDALFGR